ncbi:hypothetical protein V6B16_09010 [Salinimicrobium catena]|uniref:hypothetical protein n=1 Tax=Salinimicrobium catena TaxID=390640 RepID=UPI002FE4CF4D
MRNRSLLLTALFLFLLGCSTDDPAPDDQPLGVSARSFLSDENFTSLVVEIVYVNGFEPSGISLSAVKNFLQTYLNKPEGIVIKSRAVPSPDMDIISPSDIIEIENMHRTEFSSGQTLTTFIFIADGKSDSSTSEEWVLGKAYKNTSMIIFEKEIRELAESSQVSSDQVQQITIKHEFGHLFGLVDYGTPAQSDHVYRDPEDPKEKGHCEVTDCLMSRLLNYERAESLTLDELCHIDLIANGGK